MAKRNRSTFEGLQRGEMLSRGERKQIERQLQAEDPGWEIVHHNVAGIDVGNERPFCGRGFKAGRSAGAGVRFLDNWAAPDGGLAENLSGAAGGAADDGSVLDSRARRIGKGRL
jgi:hypothetical protein